MPLNWTEDCELLKLENRLLELAEDLRKFRDKYVDWNRVKSDERPRSAWEEDPIRIPELGLEITSSNYTETVDGELKEYFTWDEAMAIKDKVAGGWRLPTAAEMGKIAYALGEKDGDLDRDTFVENLKLTQRGFIDLDGDLMGECVEDDLWTSRVYSAASSRNLCTSTTDVNPRYSSYKGYGFSVRLVREVVVGGE